MYSQRGFRLCGGRCVRRQEGRLGRSAMQGNVPRARAHTFTRRQAAGKYSQQGNGKPGTWIYIAFPVTLGKGVYSPSLSSASVTQGSGHTHCLGGCEMDAVMSGRHSIPPQTRAASVAAGGFGAGQQEAPQLLQPHQLRAGGQATGSGGRAMEDGPGAGLCM